MRISYKQHRVLKALRANPAGLKAHEFKAHGVWFWFTSIHDLLEHLVEHALVAEFARFDPSTAGLVFCPVYVLTPRGRVFLKRRRER